MSCPRLTSTGVSTASTRITTGKPHRQNGPSRAEPPSFTDPERPAARARHPRARRSTSSSASATRVEHDEPARVATERGPTGGAAGATSAVGAGAGADGAATATIGRAPGRRLGARAEAAAGAAPPAAATVSNDSTENEASGSPPGLDADRGPRQRASPTGRVGPDDGATRSGRSGHDRRRRRLGPAARLGVGLGPRPRRERLGRRRARRGRVGLVGCAGRRVIVGTAEVGGAHRIRVGGVGVGRRTAQR